MCAAQPYGRRPPSRKPPPPTVVVQWRRRYQNGRRNGRSTSNGRFLFWGGFFFWFGCGVARDCRGRKSRGHVWRALRNYVRIICVGCFASLRPSRARPPRASNRGSNNNSTSCIGGAPRTPVYGALLPLAVEGHSQWQQQSNRRSSRSSSSGSAGALAAPLRARAAAPRLHCGPVGGGACE